MMDLLPIRLDLILNDHLLTFVVFLDVSWKNSGSAATAAGRNLSTYELTLISVHTLLPEKIGVRDIQLLSQLINFPLQSRFFVIHELNHPQILGSADNIYDIPISSVIVSSDGTIIS